MGTTLLQALAAGGVLAGVLGLGWVALLRGRIKRLEAKVAERSTKLHAFAVELIRAEEEQRSRIARELHDGLGQMMTAVNIELQVLRDAAPAEIQPRVDDVKALSAQVTTEMRRISHELRPAILDEMGLGEALRALVKRMSRHAKIKIELDVNGTLDVLPKDSMIACYRLVQEALNNVVRHSAATRAKVALHRADAQLAVEVLDDGKGIDYDPSSQDGHFGLLGLQERIHAIGGTFSFGPASGGGTRIEARLPL
jgi:two-component system sensor histidine kinase UhpB